MKTIDIVGAAQPISKRKFDRIEELLDANYSPSQIAKMVNMRPKKLSSVLTQIMNMPHRKALRDGAAAKPGTRCPQTKLGLRCAWLAGHYDKHGLEAWEKARR